MSALIPSEERSHRVRAESALIAWELAMRPGRARASGHGLRAPDARDAPDAALPRQGREPHKPAVQRTHEIFDVNKRPIDASGRGGEADARTRLTFDLRRRECKMFGEHYSHEVRKIKVLHCREQSQCPGTVIFAHLLRPRAHLGCFAATT